MGVKEISHCHKHGVRSISKKFSTKDKTAANYIKIGDAELNVLYKYHITNDNLNEFMKITKNMCLKQSYIVERQRYWKDRH